MASSVSSQISTRWQDLVIGVQGVADSTAACSSTSAESTSAAIDSCLKNRGGLAILAGMALVPSQHMGPGKAKSEEIMNAAITASRAQHKPTIQFLSFPESDVEGIIIYPAYSKPSEDTSCIVYNNPNGMTVADFFRDGEIVRYSPPAQLLKKYNCPIIMYDYRGSGLSSDDEPTSSSTSSSSATAASVIEDGQAVLNLAMKNYKEVTSVGSSLGGGVATVAMDSYLSALPQDDKETAAERLFLVNHDSFLTTGKVIASRSWGGWVTSFFGAEVNAERAMESLLQKHKVNVLVLCHTNDQVIPSGARMAELATVKDSPLARVVLSDDPGHAHLSKDMLKEL